MAVTTAAVIGAGVAIKSSSDQRRAADKALDTQREQNLLNRSFLNQQIFGARADATSLFDDAQVSRDIGTLAAADVLTKALEPQVGHLQAGNVAAQEALLSGLPQIQNAILGRPVDLSALQPVRLPVDESFFGSVLGGPNVGQRIDDGGVPLPDFITGQQSGEGIRGFDGTAESIENLPQVAPGTQFGPSRISPLGFNRTLLPTTGQTINNLALARERTAAQEVAARGQARNLAPSNQADQDALQRFFFNNPRF